MLKQLRTKTKLIMVIVCVFFIGMIVFQWGMDIGGKRRGLGTQDGVIGEVNGVKIKYQQFDALVRQQRDSQNQDQRSTLDQSRKIYDDTWDYLVTNTLIEQEIAKRGISYTDKELVDYMLNNPSQTAYQVPMFKNENTFDIAKYQAFITNPENLQNPQSRQFINYIEIEARRMLPIVKLSQSLENGIIIKDNEVREKWLRENEELKIAWFYINSANLLAYSDSVNTNDVKVYFEEHKIEYKHEEMRGIEAVFVRLLPTSADSFEVLDQAKLIYERARRGDDFAELANTYSEDPGNEIQGKQRGGDLGFFGKGTMTPEFEKVAFSMKPGEVSAPFLTRFGYHIVKVDSIKYKEPEKKADSGKKGKVKKTALVKVEPEIDQIKARHILLKIEASGQTQEAVGKKITGFYEAVHGGMDFNLRAQADSLQIMRFPLIAKNSTFIPNVGRNVQMLVNHIFRVKKGEVLPVYNTDTGSYVFKVSEIKGAGIPTFEETESKAVEDYKSKMRREYIEKYCAKVNNNLKRGMDLGSAMKAMPDTLIKAFADTSVVNRKYYVPGLGELNPFIVAVFKLANPGDCTGPVVTDSGCGLAVLLEKLPLDESRYESEKGEIKTKLENDLKNEVMTRFMEDLKKNSKIIDNRDLYINL